MTNPFVMLILYTVSAHVTKSSCKSGRRPYNRLLDHFMQLKYFIFNKLGWHLISPGKKRLPPDNNYYEAIGLIN